MSEYVITPSQKRLPSATHLMDELHHFGFPVEINLKGADTQWESIRFFEPGPPEIECLLSIDKDGRFTVSASVDTSLTTRELQLFLVNVLLKEVGGQVDHTGTRERFTAEEFARRIKKREGIKTPSDIFWMLFPWIVVALGLGLYFIISPQLRSMDLIIVAFSFFSALGLSSFSKSE